MRVVILCSSPYSETGCAMAARLAQAGRIPVGALSLPAWDRRTLLRKIGQWGLRDSYRFARAKIGPTQANRQQIRNPYLQKMLARETGAFRSLFEVARYYKFPVATCADQNSRPAIEQLKRWSPDIAIFTGGNIVREAALKQCGLGIVNAHLALLPEIRGMSSPEWSVLQGVPLGITIHFMDSGIDTGPILLRRESPKPHECDSFTDLRNRMIAAAIDWMAETLAALEAGTISPTPQASKQTNERGDDSQYFVMHDRLKALAKRRLAKIDSTTLENAADHAGVHNG